MIISWPGKIAAGVSSAVNSQVDFLASFASLTGAEVPAGAAPDSVNLIDALLGTTTGGRDQVVLEGISGIALRSGDWKFIPPHGGQPLFKAMRSGNSPQSQLYNLADDPSEITNLAKKHPEKLKQLAGILNGITDGQLYGGKTDF